MQRCRCKCVSGQSDSSFKNHHSHHSWRILQYGPSIHWDDISTLGRGGHRGFKALLQYFLPTVMNSILLSLHVTSHWSTIYHALFVSWGLGRYPSSIISKCYGYACLFALLRMIYYCPCSVFNMQTTLVNQAGINTIILYQTVRDAIYWMWGTCFILGS